MKRNWFLPQEPDVLGLLRQQAQVTQEGMLALYAWANAEPDAAQQVRDWEHKADDVKKELRRALTNAFITPIDAEDVYVMSERLDAVLNGAKNLVREAEVMGIEPDGATADMAKLLAEGVHQLTTAFERLSQSRHGDGDETATAAADAAVKTQRQVERVYRKAASALLTVDDLREVIGRRELYRRFSRVSETLIEAADRVWYATVKEG